jgi:hypothetical protein
MGRGRTRVGARAIKRKSITGLGSLAEPPSAVAAALVALTSTEPGVPGAKVAAALSETTADQPVDLPDGHWAAADAAVVGTAHLRANPPKPCQDATLADATGRPLVVLADGAGSAAVSHVGAAAVVAGVRRLCRTLEGDLMAALDANTGPEGLAESIARRIVAHTRGILDDLAELHLRDPEDFRCTLLVWLAGRQRALWLKVGDGALVAEAEGACLCVGPAGKGEFANQTCFIGPRLEDRQWAWGEIDTTRITGLAAMSDGAAERLVASDLSRVSPAVGKLLRGVAESQVGRREIFGLLAEAEFWKGTSGDDKSLGLVARALPPA